MAPGREYFVSTVAAKDRAGIAPAPFAAFVAPKVGGLGKDGARRNHTAVFFLTVLYELE